MGLTQKHENLFIGLIITAIAVALFASAYTTGFYWDYFSLWGMLAKWTWATGNFATGPQDLPSNFWYGGLLTRGYGYLLHLVGLKNYPDAAWSYFVVASIFGCAFGWGLTLWRAPLRQKPRRALLYAAALVLIHAGLFKDCAFGGCVDVTVGLAVGLFLHAVRERQMVHALPYAAFILFLKAISLPWLLLATGLSLVFEFWPSGPENRPAPRRILAAVGLMAGLAILYLLVKPLPPQGASLNRGEYGAGFFLHAGPGVYLKRIAGALGQLFTRNNFMASVVFLAILLGVPRSRTQNFALLYFAGGAAVICLIYLTLLKDLRLYSGFYSLDRYSLVPVLSLISWLLLDPILDAPLSRWSPPVRTLFLVAGAVLALARLGEELPRFVRKIPEGSSICRQFGDHVCQVAAQLQKLPLEQRNCDVLRASNNFLRAAGFDPHAMGYFEIYALSYRTLPTRLYFEVSQIAPPLRVCTLSAADAKNLK